MNIRIRVEYFIALLLGLAGLGALVAVWFSRAILVFHLDEYAGGELDYLAESAFQLAPAQIALLTLGALLVVAAVALLLVGFVRSRGSAREVAASA
jgi:hypothetical protein